MSSEASVTVQYQHKNLHLAQSNTTLVQTLLESACSQLHLTPVDDYRLVLSKDQKAIDHSMTMKLANLKQNVKLEVVSAPAKRTPLVALTLQHRTSTYNVSLPSSSTLFSILETLESTNQQQWTQWTGVPEEPVKHAGFEVHINLPGYMQPVVEVNGKRFMTNDELQKTTLANLGLSSDHPTQPKKVKLKLTHEYQAPKKTEQEQKQIIEQFHKRYAEVTGAAASASSSSSSSRSAATASTSAEAKASTTEQSVETETRSSLLPAVDLSDEDEFKSEEEEDEDIDVDDEGDDSNPAKAAPFVLPADRNLKILHALPGIIPPPELSEEFYEITERDQKIYAKGIQQQARKAREEEEMVNRLNGRETKNRNEDDENDRPMAASAASSSASPSVPHHPSLLNSSRLPALPSSSARSAARVKRTCKATLLRIRFPRQHIYVEALFTLDETPRAVYELLDTLIDDELRSQSYYLYITPPRQVLPRQSRLTFRQLQLYPQSLIHIGVEATREQAQGTGGFVVPKTAEEDNDLEKVGVGMIKQEWRKKIVQIKPAAAAAAPTPTEASAEQAADAATEPKTSMDTA